MQLNLDGFHAQHLQENPAESERGQKSTVAVPVIRLAHLLDHPIDLLKLDIEEAETRVLLDCKESLDFVEHLFVEYHSHIKQEQRIDELLGVLRDSGFRVHIQPELVAERPFVQRLKNYGMDHCLNIFAYRS